MPNDPKPIAVHRYGFISIVADTLSERKPVIAALVSLQGDDYSHYGIDALLALPLDPMEISRLLARFNAQAIAIDRKHLDWLKPAWNKACNQRIAEDPSKAGNLPILRAADRPDDLQMRQAILKDPAEKKLFLWDTQINPDLKSQCAALGSLAADALAGAVEQCAKMRATILANAAQHTDDTWRGLERQSMKSMEAKQ